MRCRPESDARKAVSRTRYNHYHQKRDRASRAYGHSPPGAGRSRNKQRSAAPANPRHVTCNTCRVGHNPKAKARSKGPRTGGKDSGQAKFIYGMQRSAGTATGTAADLPNITPTMNETSQRSRGGAGGEPIHRAYCHERKTMSCVRIKSERRNDSRAPCGQRLKKTERRMTSGLRIDKGLGPERHLRTADRRRPEVRRGRPA